jgi:linoleoyl-CoA desaturase
MLGAANISGGELTHLMTGNLSFQVEHHLYPDLPSNRYKEISPKVQELFERYGLTYAVGPMPKQLASAWGKVLRLALPNDFLSTAVAKVDPVALTRKATAKAADKVTAKAPETAAA